MVQTVWILTHHQSQHFYQELQGVVELPCFCQFEKMKTCLFAAILFTLCVMWTQAQTAQDHLVTSLPGFNGNIKFKSYTGYLLANSTNGHNLFYWFMESQNNPATDPVVLCTNGKFLLKPIIIITYRRTRLFIHRW